MVTVNNSVNSKWLPANCGKARDIPDTALFHHTVRTMLQLNVLESAPLMGVDDSGGYLQGAFNLLRGKELANRKGVAPDLDVGRWWANDDESYHAKH